MPNVTDSVFSGFVGEGRAVKVAIERAGVKTLVLSQRSDHARQKMYRAAIEHDGEQRGEWLRFPNGSEVHFACIGNEVSLWGNRYAVIEFPFLMQLICNFDRR